MKTDLGNKMPRSVKYNHTMNKTIHIDFFSSMMKFFLACQHLLFYEFIRIQHNGKRSIIHQFYFHICTKASCLYNRKFFLHAAMIYSYKLFASSGFPALIKDGRFPFLQSAYKVN